MESESDPYFSIFEKRRLKVSQMHRNRREELLNLSRNIIEQEGHFSNDEAESEISCDRNQLEMLCSEETALKNQVECIRISPLCEDNESITNNSRIESEKQEKETDEMVDEKEPEKYKKHSSGSYSDKRKYERIIQIPSWLITVPENLKEFYCCARPNGKMGLLVFNNGIITFYDKNGRKIMENHKNLVKNVNNTILEAYLQENGNYIISDVICWKGNILSTESFEFRFSWLVSNFNTNFSKCQKITFNLIQYFGLTNQEELRKVYNGNFGYEKEGLLFVHKDSLYLHGLNEDVMIWKDFHTSKYPINSMNSVHTSSNEMVDLDSNMKEDENHLISGVGKLSKSGGVFTLECHKIAQTEPQNRSGYIRFVFSSLSFVPGEERIEFKDLRLTETKKYHINKADPLSKIVFQYRIRHDPLTFEHLCLALNE